MGILTKGSTSLPEVFLIEPKIFSESRGIFFESYSRRDMEGSGIPEEFVQDNHSCSVKGVIRGLHFQSRHPQGKLIRVLKGSIFDVVTDIRKNSPLFGRSIGVEISAKSHRMLWVPIGFAHGFLALENHTEVLYKTTDFYYSEYEAGIRWKRHGINSVIISDKDARLPLLKEIESPFTYRSVVS
jgi:dTDP-4-dehydrorhamnose 3,5-epimerase